MRHRQHGNANLRVFVLFCNGQRPEVRRCPDENDQEKQNSVAVNFSRNCDPAEERWCCAGGSANDNILWRRVFQIDSVDNGVTNQRTESQYCGQRIDDKPEHRHGHDAKRCCKRQCLSLGQFSLWQWPALRSRHVDVNACVEHVIDNSTGGGSHTDTQCAENECDDTGPAGYRQHHADDRREDDEHDDPGLG